MQVELAHDVAAVDFYRREADAQVHGDAGRAATLGQQSEHLTYARGIGFSNGMFSGPLGRIRLLGADLPGKFGPGQSHTEQQQPRRLT